MVSDLQSPARSNQLMQIWVPEFGLLTNRQLDFNKRYHGRVYRWSTESMKTVSDALGFSARFDMAAVRTAYVDLCKSEGLIVFEMERNTRPTDISLRYSGEKWHAQESGGAKGQEALRPWKRLEYRSRYLDQRMVVQIADALRIRPDDLTGAYARFNFKERTFGLIVEERQAEVLPTGSFSWFSVPGNSVPTVVAEETPKDEAALAAQVAATEYGADADSYWETDTAGAGEMTDKTDVTNESATATAAAEAPAASETTITVTQPEQPVSMKPAESAQTEPAPVAEAAVEQQPAPAAEATAAATTSSASETTAEPAAASAEKPAPAPAPVPLAVAAAQARGPKKAAPTYDTPLPQPKPQPRPAISNTYSQSGGQAKYETYSKSEVDYMLKQQAESILSALSGKVATQQRAFQEAIASQEKAFNRISSDFLAHLDATRVKLENTAKGTHENTKNELETFHKQLEKELEQYRTQINKVVLPVTKAIEGKTVPTAKDNARQGNVSPKVQQALQTTHARLERLLVLVMGLSVVNTVAVLIVMYCVLHNTH